MKLLLDTHVFIWWRNRQRNLAPAAIEALTAAEAVFVSLASAWEAAIKAGLGRIRLHEDFEAGIVASGFKPLPIEFGHVQRIVGLPHHHRDPFDRLLIAQALVEGLTLVTEDRKFDRYDVPLLNAL